jgi:predicted aminopeptidase
MAFKKIGFIFYLAGAVVFLGGCGFSPISYLFSAAVGEVHVLTGTVPIEAAVNDPNTSAENQEKIRWVQETREYAQTVIGLNVGKSYLAYYDSGEDGAIYSLSASRRDALEPHTWCIPVEGTVEGLGYFYKNLAESYAEQLKTDGYDTVIYGALAYSTEGWFADPLYSSLLILGKPTLADAVIHELTHNTISMMNDTQFNESVASFVGKTGALNFIASVAGKNSDLYRQAVEGEADDALVTEFLNGVYQDLVVFYSRTDLSSEEKIAQRDQVFLAHREKFVTDYLPRFHDPEGMKEWGDLPVNNAWVLLNRRYNKRMDLFEDVYQACGRDLSRAVGVFVEATGSGNAWQYLEDWLNNQPNP